LILATADVERSPRAYRSELRQRQAEETRLRVVAAAAALFADLGYARTTLAKIAAAAGVSAETV
jgi:AcrR family transcriptional regulator